VGAELISSASAPYQAVIIPYSGLYHGLVSAWWWLELPGVWGSIRW